MRRMVLLLSLGLCALLLLGVLPGCGEQNLETQAYKQLKDDIKKDLKAEIMAELKTSGMTMEAAAPAAPAAAAAAPAEEEEEDPFGC